MSEQFVTANFYYHPRLRIMPPPPTAFVNPETGDVVSLKPMWYLEIVNSFTDDDLLQYYCEAMKITNLHPDDRKKYLGALIYLARRHGIDIILYAIDSACGAIEDPLDNPLKLEAFVYQGIRVLNRQIFREKERGMDHVVERTC
jgi:hypothetical protein